MARLGIQRSIRLIRLEGWLCMSTHKATLVIFFPPDWTMTQASYWMREHNCWGRLRWVSTGEDQGCVRASSINMRTGTVKL